MAKIIKFDAEAINKLKEGVAQIANAVKPTLGPGGRTAILESSFGEPKITKDGVTVAKEVELKDPIQNMGAQVLKAVSSGTGDKVGDGTTTSIVLAEAIFEEGLKHVTAGANAVKVKAGIDKAVEEVIHYLTKKRKEITSPKEIAQIACISANNDASIGSIIADAMQKIGKDGVITVEEAKGTKTEVKVVEGMEFDSGYISPYFITNAEKRSAELDNPFILTTDKKISNLKELLPILEAVSQSGKPLLIIAEDMEGEALATMVINRMRGALKAAVVKAPGYGDRRKQMLEDIAVLTSGTVIAEEKGYKLANATLSYLGTAEKVRVTANSTVIVNGKGKKEAIQNRINEIKHLIDHADSDYEKEKQQERLAKLAGGVAVIHIGAATELEMKEKKDRMDDALAATRAAVEEGILPGGGVAFLRAAEELKTIYDQEKDRDLQFGIAIVQRALGACIKTILENEMGDNYHHIIHAVKEHKDYDYGFDVRQHKFGSLIEAGVVDPFKVARLALQNAASAAGTFLTAKVVITNDPDEKKELPASPGGMGPGMGGMM